MESTPYISPATLDCSSSPAQGPGLEILVFCGLLLILLIACLYSIFCRVQNHGRPEHRMQEDHIAALTSASDVSVGESVRSTVPTTVRQNPPPPTTVRQNPPPPPYHIAILIPPSNTTDETPPPSYDKVMRWNQWRLAWNQANDLSGLVSSFFVSVLGDVS